MTNKELKSYIKKKADEVEIKDFSVSIIERASHLPRVEEQVIEKKRFSLRLNPLTTSILTLMTTILLVLILLEPTGITPVEEEPVLENMENVIALSSVQATSLIDVLETELSYTPSISYLRFGPNEKNNKLTDEIKDVSRYLETIEKLYASNENFEVSDTFENKQGFGRHMRFKTRDLTDRETEYEILYNQSINKSNQSFNITGEIRLGTKAYLMMAHGIKGQTGVHVEVSDGSLNTVILDYTEVDGVHTYLVELVRNDQSVQKVEIKLEQNEEEKIATLTFVEGKSTGTYTFRIVTEDRIKIISVRYSIQFDDEVEEGEITIRILTLQQQTLYQIVIKPEGRPSFIITRGRFQPRMNSNTLSTNI